MKIALVHGRYFNSWEALGLGYIGGYLKHHLQDAEVVFYQGCFDDDETIIDGCANADIVAFSCTTPTVPHSVSIIRRLKEINPRIHTVMGGYHPSAVPQDCLTDGIDQVVTGEGEAAMLDIVRGNRDRVVAGRIMSFEELPWPDRELIRNERNIQVAFKDNQKRITSFQSHRACPFMCKYCLDGFNKVLYGFVQKAPVRYRPVPDLLDEIEEVTRRYQLDLIKFSDPTWNTNIEWVVAFCRQKIKRQCTVPFYPNMHATIASEEMIQLMAEAGCFEIAIGVESGSPKILKQIGKGTTVATIKRCVSWAKNAGIIVRGYFILGMPEETEEDLVLTERLAEELELDEYGFTILCPYPGTQMYDPVGHGGIAWEHTDEYSNDFWATKTVSNARLKEWQARLSEKFAHRLTWHNRVLDDADVQKRGQAPAPESALVETRPAAEAHGPMRIPMSGPDITDVEIEAVNKVMRTSVLSIGQNITEFEKRFASYTGAAGAVAVSSGTAGLHLCVQAALADLESKTGWREGDPNRPALVVTTPFSFVSSSNTVLYERAVPVFVDVEPESGNIDAHQVIEAVSDLMHGGSRATKWLPPALKGRRDLRPVLAALMPVHVFGQPSDLDPLVDVARAHGLACIEDACEAVGSEYKGRAAGTIGTAGVFAFYPNKQMTTGEGGLIVTDSEEWEALFRSLRNQGRDTMDGWLAHTRIGYNYRLDEMSAALGAAQVGRLDELLAKREAIANRYTARLQDHPLVRPPRLDPSTTRMSWFVYVVKFAETVDRNDVIQRLAKRGIPSRPYFPPIHLQKPYVERFGYTRGCFPVAEQLGDSSLALPFSSVMTEAQVDDVCDCLIDALREFEPAAVASRAASQ
jgi:perosamine synthetase